MYIFIFNKHAREKCVKQNTVLKNYVNMFIFRVESELKRFIWIANGWGKTWLTSINILYLQDFHLVLFSSVYFNFYFKVHVWMTVLCLYSTLSLTSIVGLWQRPYMIYENILCYKWFQSITRPSFHAVLRFLHEKIYWQVFIFHYRDVLEF